MAETKPAPYYFRQKVWDLAKTLEFEHDNMLNYGEPPNNEFDQESLELSHPKIWDHYAEINEQLWKLVLELEELALSSGPVNDYGRPAKE
jgi:hypothetical protein